MSTKPKPRLSMKLLWKALNEWQTQLQVGSNREMAGAHSFLTFLERQMKPLKP